MNVLVDSSVLIDVLRGREGRADLLERLVARGSLLCSCDITLAEIYAGMLEPERTRTEDLLGSLFYLPCEAAVARRAGLLRRAWRAKGHSLTLADTFLAALCIQHGVVLLTDNKRHFPMKDLVVWTPADVPSA